LKALVSALRFLFAAGSILAGLGAALGGIGAIGGAFSLRLDTLGHFAPIWAAAGLAAMIAGLIGGSRLGFWLGMAGFLCAAALIVPEAIAAWNAPRAPIAQPTLRIVEFNLWGRNHDQNRTADWILAQDADILVLEEAYGGTEQIIRRLRERYPHEAPCLQNPCSSLILSRIRPTRTGGMDHAPGLPRLSGVWADFQGPGGPFTVVGVHLTWPYPAGPQAAQMRLLAETIGHFNRDRLIIAGDFNSTPWSFGLRTQDRALGIPRYSRALPSWPAAPFTRRRTHLPFPVLPIDHVYAGPGWHDVRVVRGPRLGSDHYPLIVTLSDAEGG
jgi:endonuclease/exonuclease/phosphatase (EEP) superfamily protein YafD